ncbi:hypothetical protein EVA_04998 [gut metagenome]|uniref:Uncharacterized protein n=1 Tax=gut metagenome TaxID=749906 RepID=J9GID5_9ZZZZ
MEWLDARHHQFDNAIGFLFQYTRHHHASIGHYKHINQEGGDEAGCHSDSAVRKTFTAFGIALDGRHTDFGLYVFDDLLDAGYTRCGQLVFTYLFVEYIFDIGKQSDRYFFIGIDGHSLRVFDQITANLYDCLVMGRVGIVSGVVGVGHWHKAVIGIVAQQADITSRHVTHGYSFLLIILNRCQPHGYKDQSGKDKRA